MLGARGGAGLDSEGAAFLEPQGTWTPRLLGRFPGAQRVGRALGRRVPSPTALPARHQGGAAWAMRPGTGPLGQVLPTGRLLLRSGAHSSCLPAPGSTRPLSLRLPAGCPELRGTEAAAAPRPVRTLSLLPGPDPPPALHRPPSPHRWALGTCVVAKGCCHPGQPSSGDRGRGGLWPHGAPTCT